MRVFFCLNESDQSMRLNKTEATELIKKHIKELNETAEKLGGVFITGIDGTVAVIGAKDFKRKIIFQTSFVSDKENVLLDAEVDMQDLLEDAGVEAISEHDFNIAIGAH
jgi:F0F1-type ATP synthase alpha subunit